MSRRWRPGSWGSLARAADRLPTAIGTRAQDAIRRAAIRRSHWFDPDWYLAAHDDLHDVDPLDHFLSHGESEHRDPGPDFRTSAYEWRNPAASGRALTHFLLAEGGRVAPDDVIDTTRPVIAERWFDTDWFADRNDLTDLHPLPEPIRTARAWSRYRALGGPPSPYFDPDDAVRRRGTAASPEPLVAWDRDREEADVEPGRVVAGTSSPPHGPLGVPRLLPRTTLATARVAVAIHVFHTDVLDDLLERLVWIPGEVTVLVTTPDSGAVGGIDARITEHLGQVARSIVVTPNIGRNFGPLLDALDEPLRSHDVVLHLHTKKSLGSGTEQVDWRRHLVHGLLPSPAGVQAIVGALVDPSAPSLAYADPTTTPAPRPAGVVTTTTWPGLPRFANHWLGNRGHGRRLHEALGLDPDDAAGWLDYPVGGMFWARVDALRPLLDLTIRPYEFEDELGQADRTLAHAVERIVPAAARVAGYDVVELDHDAAEWRWNWSTRNAEGVGVFDDAALRDLDARLAEADVVSVDLFDTLLLRPTTDPDALFDVLATTMELSTPLDAGERAALVRERRDAEHRLRTAPSGPGDVTLGEIETEMVAGGGVDASRARELVRAELALETRLAMPRRWLIERLRKLRVDRPEVRVVLMTDTTQPPAAIDDLLTRIGAADAIDVRYVSNERRARKDDGSLWQLVEERERPRRLLHIGDNPTSDLQQASDRGHRWFQTPAPGEVPQLGGVELREIGATGVGSRRRATELLVGHGLAAAASELDPDARTPEPVLGAEAFGFSVLGPVVTAFARWCIETGTELGLDVLLFGGRDGHLAHAIATRLGDVVTDAPRVDYLPMSRRAALGARLERPGGLDAVVSAGAWEGSLGSMLRTRTGLIATGPTADREISLPADRRLAADLLAEMERAGSIDPAAHGAAEADALRRAVDEASGGAARVGFVDLGYSGTILRALREVTDRRISGLFAVSTDAIDDLDDVHTCFRPDARLGHGDLVYDRAKLFEVFCSRIEDQAARYTVESTDSGDTTVRLVTVPGTAPDRHTAEVVRRAQLGALDFVESHLARFGPEWLAAPVDPVAVRRSYEVAVRHGLPDPTDLFGDITLDDDFGNRGRVLVVDD